ncbi:hypothetical protein AYJ54_00730 [Bradyrhizobium centrolobii]|uniref:Uncharacterized protein n=1 Tax=Bradyrhizobium centrolobii TaxID=1505087 RepID=A0A176YFQ0_9BRAD|nr:hypothetical protein [Bradyrhizobium centrolobii]OAF05463.1 hypothetical protein AYJ54_00730 [Bradyrhizobium centrolobii]
MAAFLDVCRFTPTAGGTTDWTYSSAVTGYQSPAVAGVVNGRLYKYRAESSDLTQWEVGEGAYNTSTGVLARTTVLFNSLGTTAKISFSAAPQVAVVALKEDMLSIEEANSFTNAQKLQALANVGIANWYFSASLSANQSFTSGFTKVNFDSELADPSSWYDNTTNFRFQPTVAGKYRITASVQGSAGTSLSEIDLDIRKNSVADSRTITLVTGPAGSSNVSKLVSLNGSTDFVEIFTQLTGTGTLTILGGSAPFRTWFEAKWAGS